MREHRLFQQERRVRKRKSKKPFKTRQHRLLLFGRLSRRFTRLLSLLILVMLVIGLYDQFTEFLGDYWFAWWGALFILLAQWVYYVTMMRRASIQVKPQYLRLQGPVIGYNISYGRIRSVTSGKMEQHFDWEKLKKNERNKLKPFYNQTCLFIELSSYPRSFRWRNLWFPRFLFSTTRQGLICHVDDWMALSRDIESARSLRHNQRDHNRFDRENTLVGHVLAEEM